ncbi:UNVERIFIED_CONTAM: hypothetical protein HDU68_002145 [Siphonaria sp. JEL0065]|nr:hypothetical protein HDU68_002145 [Siphonaria sp. JEL0065]
MYKALLFGSLLALEVGTEMDRLAMELHFGHLSQQEAQELIRILLSNRTYFDPSCGHNTPIRFCASKGYVEALRLLLKASGVDPAARNNWALRKAVQKGHASVVAVLISDERVCANSEPGGNDAFVDAAKEDTLMLLLKYDGIDRAKGKVALTAASSENHPEVAKFLASGRVDPAIFVYKSLVSKGLVGF